MNPTKSDFYLAKQADCLEFQGYKGGEMLKDNDLYYCQIFTKWGFNIFAYRTRQELEEDKDIKHYTIFEEIKQC